MFTEEITDSLNTVSEELIANIDISDLTTFIERETILSESEVEANLNFNANLADSNLELSSLDEFAAIEAFLSAF